MNDLNVVVKQQAAVISANFEEIKSALTVEMDQYKGIVYDNSNIVSARNDVATLRKVAKALDTKRKEVKKAHMIPYEEFDKQAKELIEIINGAVEPIDKQIKEYEEEKRQERKIAIQNYFNDKAEGNEYVCLDECWDPKWISNIGTSMKSIRTAIDTYIEGRLKDIEAIQAFGSDVTDKAIEKYLKTKQLYDAINIIQEHERMKAEIIRQEEERRKKDEERKHQEELERVRREEAERVRKEELERKRIAEEAAAKAREEERQRIAEEQTQKVNAAIVEPEPIVQNDPVNFLGELEPQDPLPPVVDDIPFDFEPQTKELEPLSELEPLEDITVKEDREISAIAEILTNHFMSDDYSYMCDIAMEILEAIK
ncbi:MAG: DUF1351 domain-containing protein [bacterium]|nr:DUF1351 domain-containing protein [bacterium]